MTVRAKLPELNGAAGMCGSGESVTGPLCVAVAAALWVAAQIWKAAE